MSTAIKKVHHRIYYMLMKMTDECRDSGCSSVLNGALRWLQNLKERKEQWAAPIDSLNRRTSICQSRITELGYHVISKTIKCSVIDVLSLNRKSCMGISKVTLA